MKKNLALSAVTAMLVIFGAMAHAKTCADVNSKILFEGMAQNLCPHGASPTTNGRLEMAFDKFKAQAEINHVIYGPSAREDRALIELIREAQSVVQAYPGKVDIAQVVWHCGNRAWGKQIVYVGEKCEQLGPTFHYYDYNTKVPVDDSGSLLDMWYY